MTTGTIVNLVGFQIGWFACVLGAAAGAPWLGPVVVMVVVAPQVWTVADPTRRFTTLAAAALLGYAADSALALAGLIAFPPAAALGGPAPLWMVAMWVNFAATLNDSLAWLASRAVLATSLGLIGGPLAYVAGHRLGAIVFDVSDPVALTAIAIAWAIATPLLVGVAHRTVGGAAALDAATPGEMRS